MRGHVGIEAVAGAAARGAPTRCAASCVDVLCLAFCALFAWKSWTLLHEAWVDKQTTSSSWAPPLWIPYRLMSLGMTLLALQLLVQSPRSVNRARAVAAERSLMTMLALGLLFGAVTLLFMFSGTPIAFALGAVAVVFMAFFMPASSLDTVTQNVYEEMASITLLSIPLFILKGAAIGRSRAGQDLYAAHARLDAARPRRPRHRQRVRLRAVRGDGRIEPGDVLGDRHRPASPRCASAATRRASPPASSPPAARSASCCRRRSR